MLSQNSDSTSTVAVQEAGPAEPSALVVDQFYLVTDLRPHTTLRRSPVPSNLCLPAEDTRHYGLCAVNDPELTEDSVMPGTSYSVHQATLPPRDVQDDPGKPPKVPQRIAASSLSTSDELPFPTLDGAPPTASSTYIPSTRELRSSTSPISSPHSECIC